MFGHKDSIRVSYGMTVSKDYQSKRADFAFDKPANMTIEDANLICVTAVRAMLGLRVSFRGSKLYYDHFNEEISRLNPKLTRGY